MRMGIPAKTAANSAPEQAAAKKGAAPYGRQQVRAALIASAAELFAARGPARVPLREIADHAGVNLGQIPRHFGSKDALLAAVIETLGQQISAESSQQELDGLDRTLSFFDATGASPLWRVIARAVLDGYDLGSLQKTFPLVGALVEFLERERAAGRLADEFDPRTSAAVMAALGLGWLLFEPFLVAAAGLNDRSPEKILEDVHTILASGFLRITASADDVVPPDTSSASKEN